MKLQKRKALLATVLVTCIASPGCMPKPGGRSADTLSLGVAGRINMNAATAAAGSLVVVTWTAASPAGGADVFAATSPDGGRSFGPPVQVNDITGSVRTSGEQAPRVAVSPGVVAVAWTSRESNLPAVRVATSHDRGQSFGPSQRVHPDGLTGARGWASVAIDARNRLHVVWLDGRNASAPAASAPAMTHAMPAPVAGMDHARAPRQDLYAAVVNGSEAITDRLVATDTCFCCKTTVAALADGSSVAAWRHLFPSNVRDIAVAHFGASTTPDPRVARVSHDDWELHGCPEDGPAIAVDGAGTTHVAWPTLVQDDASGKGVFYAASTDNVTFTPRARLDAMQGSQAAHPQIAARRDGGVAVVWEQMGQAAHPIEMRMRAPGSTTWSSVTLTADGVYPAVAALDAGFVVAWTNDTAIKIRVVPE